jgi:uncharacterized coiled-coil protein SlyX
MAGDTINNRDERDRWGSRWFMTEAEPLGRVPPNDHDRDAVERRLDAVERALAEDEPIDRIERIDDLETRVAELEAAVQALRGYVSSVRAVNEEIEHRADRALRRAEAVERNVAPGRPPTRDDETGDSEDASPLSRLRERL